MRSATPAWGGSPPAPFACSGFCVPGESLYSGCSVHFCARAVFLRLALCFYARAVLMLGIRPDCLRSEPRL